MIETGVVLGRRLRLRPTVGEADESATLAFDNAVDELEAIAIYRGGAPEQPHPEDPFDLEILSPRAIGIRSLYSRAGRTLPVAITSSLGPGEPVLIYHGITPFHKPGATPTGVWGLGYRTAIQNVSANTVSVQPTGEALEVGTIKQHLRLGISADGILATPSDELKPIETTLGVELPSAKLELSTDNEIALLIHVPFTLLKIQAAPVAAGGARWNMYRQDERLDCFQPLLQTVLVPHGTKSLVLETTAWAKRSAGWFGLRKAQLMSSGPQVFQVPLERF
jgi:hypothetical protein